MKDRYLFRGKRTGNGEWVTGFLFKSSEYITAHNTCIATKPIASDKYCLCDYCYSPINSATIGQCTGRRDKNEKLIFEGDIVSYTRDVENYERELFTIVWNKDYAAFNLENSKGGLLSIPDDGEFVIESNIHDNSELMEVNNESNT